MAKGDHETVQSDINAQKPQDQSAVQGLQNNISSNIGTLQGQQKDQLGQVQSGFQNFAGTGGVSDEIKQNLSYSGPNSIVGNIPPPSSYNLGGLGSLPVANYSEPQAGYRDLSKTGGVDLGNATDTYHRLEGNNATTDDIVKQLSNVKTGMQGGVYDTVDKLKELGVTGGISDAEKANVLRPLYFENEKTGGYTPQQLADMKAESNASVPSFYSSLTDALNRQRATSGYSPGFSNANQALTMQGANAAADQARKTRIGLAESVRTGQTNAADAIQKGQLGLSGITSPVKENALSSAGTIGTNLVGQQITGLNDAGGLNIDQQKIMLAAAAGDKDAQALIQSGKIAGLGGLTNTIGLQNASQVASASAGAGNAFKTAQFNADNNFRNAQLGSGNVIALGGLTQQGQEYGTSGLSHLYDSSTNQLTDQQKMQLATVGMNSDEQARLLGLQAGVATQPGSTAMGWDNTMGAIGSLAGGITGISGAVGGIKALGGA